MTDAAKTWTKRIIATLLGLPFALVFLVLLGLQTGPGKAFVASQVEELVSAELNGNLTIGEIQGSMMGSITLLNTRLEDADGKLLAEVDRVDASFSLLPLLRNKLVIDAAQIDGVRAAVVFDKDGVLNFLKLVETDPADESETNFLIEIERMQVRNSGLVYLDQGGADIPDYESPAALFSKLDLSDNMSAMATMIVLDQLTLDGGLSIDISGPIVAHANSVQAKLGASHLIGGDLSASDVRFKMEGEQILASIEDMTAAGIQGKAVRYEGTTKQVVSGEFNVPPSALNPVLGRIGLKDTGLALLKPLLVNTRMDIALETKSLEVFADLRSEGSGNASLHLNLDAYDAPEPSFNALVRTRDFAANDVLAGIPVSSRLNLDLVGQGRGFDPLTMDADVELAIRRSQVDEYFIRRVYIKASKRAQSLTIEEALLDSPYLSASLEGVLDTQGKFNISAKARNAPKMNAELRRVLGNTPPAVTADLDAKGQLDFTAFDDPWKLVETLTLNANWSLRDFEAEDISVKSSSGRVKLDLRGKETRKIRWDVSAKSSRNRVKTMRAARLDIDTKGNATLLPEHLTKDILAGIPRADADLRLRIEGLRSPLGNVDRASVNTVTRVENRQVSVSGLDLSALGVSTEYGKSKAATIKGSGVATLDQKYRPTRLDVDLDVVTLDTQIAGQPVEALDAKVKVKGPTKDLVGTIEVQARGLPIAQYDFEEVTIVAGLEGDRQFTLDVNGVQRGGMAPKNVDLKLSGKHSADLGSWNVDNMQVQTVGESWNVTNDVERRADGTLVFNHLELTHENDKIKVDGVFKPGHSQDIQAELVNFAIEKIESDFGVSQLEGLRGKVSGKASIKGSAEAPIAEFSLTIQDFYYQEMGPFNLKVEGAFSDELLQVYSMHLEGWGHPLLDMAGLIPLRARTTGEFEILRHEETTLDIEFATVDLDKVAHNIPMLKEFGLGGILSGEAAFFGTLADPYLGIDVQCKQWRSTIAGEFEDTKFGPLDIKAAIEYEPTSQGGDGFVLKSSFGSLDESDALVRATVGARLDAWIAYAMAGDMDAVLRAIYDAPFRLFVMVPSLGLKSLGLGQHSAAKPEGYIDVFLSASGTLESPTGRLRARLSEFGWDRYRDIFVDLNATFGNGKLEIKNVNLKWDGDEIFEASGSLPIPTTKLAGGTKLENLELDLRAKLLPIPVAKLSAFNYSFAAVKGTLSGRLSMAGTLSEPKVAMELALKETMFANRKKGDAKLTLLTRSNRIEASAALLHEQNQVVNLKISVPANLNLLEASSETFFRTKDVVSGRLYVAPVPLAGMIPYKLFDSYVSGIKGTWEADLRFGGTLDDPTSTGVLKVSEGAGFFPTLGRGISDGEVEITLKPGEIEVVNLSFGESQGTLKMTGKVDGTLVSPKNANLEVTLKEFGTSGLTSLPTYVTAKSNIVADIRAREVTVAVSGLEVAIPDSTQQNAFPTALHQDIHVLTPRERALGLLTQSGVADLKESAKALANLKINIQPGWIRHPNAEIKFRGDLSVEFKGSESLISGDIEALTGQLEVLGKQFQLERGLLTFAGNSPPNPIVQADAIYKFDRSVSELLDSAASGVPRVIVRVSGTALEPRLKMESDPALTETEIVYVLVTDRAPATAQSGEEEGVSSQAMAAATGLLSGMMKQRASDYYPIDMLRLETDDDGISGMEVGKYFGSDLFFAYEYSFAPDPDENQSEIRVEYQFAPRWLIGTKFGDRGNGAGFLYWTVL